LLATVALAYLATLAWRPDFLSPAQQAQAQAVEPDLSQGIRAMTKALAEVGTIKRTLSDVQKDIGELKGTVSERVEQEKTVASRLSALESKVTAVPVAAAPEAKTMVERVARASDDAVAPHPAVAERAPRPASERVVPRIISVAPQAPATTELPARIETGSIVQPEPTITFGEPKVVAAREKAQATQHFYGVQLGASPSVERLRTSWGQLVQKHGEALGALNPRVIAPKSGSGPYRLVAGPLPTRAEAEKVCEQMGVGRKGCISAIFSGDPL
jgi:TolA-binding protein